MDRRQGSPALGGHSAEWLTRDHWSPLAAQDHGDVPFSSSGRQVCLVGANLAIRKDLLEQFGGFRPDVQRVQDSVGSMEDHELQIRFWKAGRHGLYVPELVVMSDVSADRLMKKYRRRWHLGHGHFYAMARLEEWEHSSVGWLFGVSSHIYKRAVVEAFRWLGCVARGNLHGAFTHETNLWFSAGFIRTRYREFATAGDRSHWTELGRFVRAVVRRLISGQRHPRRPASDKADNRRAGKCVPTSRRRDRDGWGCVFALAQSTIRPPTNPGRRSPSPGMARWCVDRTTVPDDAPELAGQLSQVPLFHKRVERRVARALLRLVDLPER